MSPRPPPWRVWLSACRPRTLPAAVAPVLVGTTLAWSDGAWVPPAAAACLAFALLIQVGTNFANDYYDYVKGADTAERIGPRRAVASGWVSARTMKLAMLAVFAAAFLVGLSLLPYGGWPLLVIGVSSILCGIAYTGGPYPLGYNGLGDVFVFVFFGLVAVGATYFVQAGEVGAAALAAGTALGALAANILVVNNYRDVETDTKAGKRTLVVRFGRGFARGQFAGSLAVAFLAPFFLWLGEDYAPWVLLPVLLVPVGLAQSRRLATAGSAAELIRLLGDTGKLLAAYALLLSIGIAVSG
jgi:1,4-dihydroxy-2-naphthoate octaprenyltransferase